MPLKVKEAQFMSNHKIVTAQQVSVVVTVKTICCFQLSDDPS